MAIRPIFETPDPVLRQISKPVETFDDELKTLVADMFETMYAAPGIGLAAVQVGVPIRLLVIDLQEPENPDDPESKSVRDPKVFINPDQYFADVPPIAWTFHIGGYQPAQKWLKDRRGRSLSFDDITHYQRIVKILTDTDRVMREIQLPLE